MTAYADTMIVRLVPLVELFYVVPCLIVAASKIAALATARHG